MNSKLLKDSIQPVMPDMFIVISATSEWHCRVCNLKLSEERFLEHKQNTEHSNALKKHGCDGIFAQANYFCCGYCKCRIGNRTNVYYHIKGKKHLSTVEIIEQEFNPIRKTDNIDPRESAREDMRNLLCTMVTTTIVKDMKIPCEHCSVIVKSCEDLHVHLAFHFNEFFSKAENTSKNINDCPEKILETQNSIINDPTNISTAFHSEDNRTINNNLSISKINASIDVAGVKNSSVRASEEIISESNEKSCVKLSYKEKIRKIRKLLDFDRNDIYELSDRHEAIEISMKLSLVIDEKTIYCLACRKTMNENLDDYYKHISDFEHCWFLKRMEEDHKIFALVPDQFSELDLAWQYMHEVTPLDIVHCFICNEDVPNNEAVNHHINNNKEHAKKFNEMQIKAKKYFMNMKSVMRCNWYGVEKYWCVPCSKKFNSEISFVKHLNSTLHRIELEVQELPRNKIQKKLIYDYCRFCAVLWLGYRCTYAYHCEIDSHKWLVRDGHHVFYDLPQSTKNFLMVAETFIGDGNSNASETKLEEESIVVEALKNAIKEKFNECDVCLIGSRAIGLASCESCVDVCIDFGNISDSELLSDIEYYKTICYECLHKNTETWEIEELSTLSTAIEVRHIGTGMRCKITFDNGLSIANTKLIKKYVDVFPPCRTLILFLKQWLISCKLSETTGISSYALYWLVIFYLQTEAILPSVGSLIYMKGESRVISGWQVGVSYDFTCNHEQSNFSIKDLLVRFFKFYGDFDFRYDIVCPLLGFALKKRLFTQPKLLSHDMKPYYNYIKNTDDPEFLAIDSVLCVQDPFELRRNLTQTMNKTSVRRFKLWCSKSVDVLSPS